MTHFPRHPEVAATDLGFTRDRWATTQAQTSLRSLRKLDCGGRSSFEAPSALASLGRGRTSESDSKYVFDISGACESAGKQANAGNQDPCFRAGDGCFEVFGEPTVAAEPGEASLDHPTSRFGLKRPKALGTSDDLNSPLAQISECVEQLRTSIDAVGKDVTQFGEHAPDDPQ